MYLVAGRESEELKKIYLKKKSTHTKEEEAGSGYMAGAAAGRFIYQGGTR